MNEASEGEITSRQNRNERLGEAGQRNDEAGIAELKSLVRAAG